MKNAGLIQFDRLELIKNKVFNTIDVSDNTRKEYFSRVNNFLQFIEQNELNEDSYLEYKRYLLRCEYYSASTKNKYLMTSKVFLDGLFRLRLIPYKITDNVKGFTQSKLHKKDGLNDDDIGKLQRYCLTLESSKTNLRLRALMALFLFQGLRQIEVVRLDITDVDIKNKKAFVAGKGKHDKEQIHLHPSVVKILKEYIKATKFREGALFRSESNNSNGSRLTTKSIREIIKQVFNLLDIEGSTHGFRHYFITKLIKAYKGELLTVSKYSRHSSIQMLEVYNDEVIRESDLPRFYNVFNGIKI